MKQSIISIACIAALGTSVVNAETLTLNISGIRSDAGTIRLALHNGAEGFPNDRTPIAVQAVPVSEGNAVAAFAGLKSGSYAISFFHDEDGDKKLGKNLLGLPTEGYGFTNDARGSFGPPKFEAAAVIVDGSDIQQTVTVAY